MQRDIPQFTDTLPVSNRVNADKITGSLKRLLVNIIVERSCHLKSGLRSETRMPFEEALCKRHVQSVRSGPACFLTMVSVLPFWELGRRGTTTIDNATPTDGWAVKRCFVYVQLLELYLRKGTFLHSSFIINLVSSRLTKVTR